MSFDPLMKALKENPALAEELKNAKTPRERHAILDAHGIEKPNLDSQFPEAGGATTSSSLWNSPATSANVTSYHKG